MRSQTAKPLTKKGAIGKKTFKTGAAAKQTKKKVSPKKIKTIQKSVTKVPKKNVVASEIAKSSKEGEQSTQEKVDVSSEASKSESSKSIPSRESSPSKKSKKENTEKKDKTKVTCKKVVAKKSVKVAKPKLKSKLRKEDDDDTKYKINIDSIKKDTGKSKVKSNLKKGNTANLKKKEGDVVKETDQSGDEKCREKKLNNYKSENKIAKSDIIDEKNSKNEDVKLSETVENKDNVVAQNKSSNAISNNSPEAPKVEHGRPPKFFISSRSPRTVDIDVKCCKNSKGNLSVSERFLSMKCESKSDDNGAKNISNNLVSQGPEIDVYTFTEKVDSPKSVLSDFRTPINKNVGRVRPIARVKGTIINKKSESERKKYSPHRPIEEVVKQLKANKRSEDLIACADSFDTSSLGLSMLSVEKELEESPKPIVSKSYKMVARKSSITGKPFSPIHFLDQDEPSEKIETKVTPKASSNKKNVSKTKPPPKKISLSDEEINESTFSLNNKSGRYASSDESLNESNDDNDNKESSGSDNTKSKRLKNKKYKRITDSAKKTTSKELKELSKDSLIDLKDASALIGNEKPSKRRLKLLSMWSGPKRHRMASLNALAKVHCLYENESRSHMELGLMKTVDRQVMPSTSKQTSPKKKDLRPKENEKQDSTSESEYEGKKEKEKDSSESSDDSNPPQRTLRGVPGIRSAGKYWDPKSSTSSSDDSELESKPKNSNSDKKKPATKTTSAKSETEKPPPKMKKTAGVPVKKKRSRNEVVMDLKDMVVQKRMASLNATAILAASYEKRSPKSSKDDSTSDSCSDESYVQKPKNGLSSGVKSEIKNEETKKEPDEPSVSDTKQKVEVIVNQDTDVTITGVYSTHLHEGFCTVSGMQYRISSTSHTQTTATANCEKEGCSREDNSRYTPLSALSSMKPPADQPHPHPVPELGGLNRRAGCSSAFSAPSPAAHHDPGYYQPAGPLIKETGADAERALARYHPPPHYHPPHPPVLQQYGSPYYPADLCYGRYYRPPGSYHMTPPQPDAPMVGVGSEPYPPPQYYGSPPCYQHPPQRIPYMEYRGCPCPLNACPKNVLIGPATGKAPASGGPDIPSILAPPGGAFRPKVWAGAHDSAADAHGSGKDPPLESEPPTAAAPHPCPLPAIGGASPKREMYDVRENLRLNANIPGPTEAIGPPSPARGACAPQPPPIPRRARLGKAMARRSLAGDDTGLLISVPVPPSSNNSECDDDVLAISPPVCAPIDLSSSDERSTPLVVDIKKENEGPIVATSRKTDAQALKEHNSTTTLSDTINGTDITKPVKRRHSRPKLEIDMKDAHLEDVCKTNGIGEHVKLQKRRKVSGDQTDLRVETVTKDQKKKVTQATKKTQRKLSSEKKTHKRKSDSNLNEPKVKKINDTVHEDLRLNNISAVSNNPFNTNPKHKSAVLLDNLLKKNCLDRTDSKGQIADTNINPAELFLAPSENLSDTKELKKNLNTNNNIVENKINVNGVRPKTIAAVSQLIGKKLAYKNACKVDSKVTHKHKTVLSPPRTPKENFNQSIVNDENNIENKCLELSSEILNSSNKIINKTDEFLKPIKQIKMTKPKLGTDKIEAEQNNTINRDKDVCQKLNLIDESQSVCNTDKMPTKCKLTMDKSNGELKGKNVEKLVKLLASKKQSKDDESVPTKDIEIVDVSNIDKDKEKEKVLKRIKTIDKQNGETKAKNVEKVVKLLVSKKTAIKNDEASLVVEDACSTPIRGTRRRRNGIRRGRRPMIPTLPDPHDRAPPRWSNGWTWDGEPYLSKVYLNNDSRLDRTARCYGRMSHASGDRVSRGDCVLLRASQARAQPFVARVASLWENPDDGEMMMSLVWYYRPEHTERGRQPTDAPDEVFASRHRDANSVACIEDKCYVLTFNEYCRYKKRLKAAEEGITVAPSIVPALPPSEVTPALSPNDTKLPPSVSSELVLFCRKIYDFRSKKIQVPNK